MNIEPKTWGTSTMKGEHAVLTLHGAAFPLGTALEIGEMLKRVSPPLNNPPKIKSQALEAISDVVVASALALIDDDLENDEAEYAAKAEQQRAAPPPADDIRAARIAAAERALAEVFADAAEAGVRLLSKVKPVANDEDL